MKRMLILAVLLAGCAKTASSDRTYDPTMYMDRVTGCQYLSPGGSDRSALTPRIAADGKTHMGCKAVKP